MLSGLVWYVSGCLTSAGVGSFLGWISDVCLALVMSKMRGCIWFGLLFLALFA